MYVPITSFKFQTALFINTYRSRCKCIFSGSKGDVCRVEPLTTTVTLHHHNSRKPVKLVALTSLTKLLVLETAPRYSVVFTEAHGKFHDSSCKINIGSSVDGHFLLIYFLQHPKSNFCLQNRHLWSPGVVGRKVPILNSWWIVLKLRKLT